MFQMDLDGQVIGCNITSEIVGHWSSLSKQGQAAGVHPSSIELEKVKQNYLSKRTRLEVDTNQPDLETHKKRPKITQTTPCRVEVVNAIPSYSNKVETKVEKPVCEAKEPITTTSDWLKQFVPIK